MRRALLFLTVAAGCGSVAAITDAPPIAVDAAVSDTGLLDGRPSVDLMKGCVMKALMDEASWTGTTPPVMNACGGTTGSVIGLGADTTTDSERGRVGSFSMSACVDFASAPALHGTTGLTMSAWVHPTGLNGEDSNGVISKRNDRGVQSEYGLFVWTGSKVYVDLGESDRYQGRAQLNNGMWSHLTAVFDSTRPTADRVRLFINGVADPLDHVTIGTLGDTLPTGDAPLHIGCTPAPASMTQQTFQGQLDKVSIWNRALSDAEIAALYAER